jgi:hypothetical protein
MKNLFSRYGGHGIQIGQGKSSNSKLPDDQSLENVLSNYAFQMKGFTYLSSFEMLPNFMESHKKLPHGSTKIAEINHTLSDILLQHEIFVDSKIYIVPTKYTNVFSCFISTDYKPLKPYLGKFDPSYDCILIIRIQEKTDSEILENLNKISQALIGLLVFEMEIKYSEIIITPSMTHIGKKINEKELNTLVECIKEVDSREELSEIIFL